MLRISNYRNEFAIVVILIMYISGFTIILNEVNNLGNRPLYAYLISSIVFILLILFILISTKIIFINFNENQLIVKNTFSKNVLKKIEKGEIKELSFSVLNPFELKVVTKENKVFYTYIKFGLKKRVKNWYLIK